MGSVRQQPGVLPLQPWWSPSSQQQRAVPHSWLPTVSVAVQVALERLLWVCRLDMVVLQLRLQQMHSLSIR